MKLRLLVTGLVLQATLADAQSPSFVRTVFNSDSMSVEYPTMSPDEKWLVFSTYVSNQEVRLMIQPLTGGSPRELAIARGAHIRPRFSPAGDRIVFLSTLPKRNEADEQLYVVSAPFDSRTGALTGPPRQISLDGVNLWGGRVVPDISPDGQWIVYVGRGTNAIKIVPVTGGMAKTLADPQTFPESIAWSADGRFLSYVVADGPAWVRMRISRDGGAAVVVARSFDRLGPVAPDDQNSYAIPWGNYWRGSTLRWFAASGQLLGEFKLPPRSSPIFSTFVAGGRYIIGSGNNAVVSTKVVSVAGGLVRQAATGTGSDCKGGWGEGGEYKVCTEPFSDSSLTVGTPASGRKDQAVRASDDPNFRRFVGSWDGQVGSRDGQLVYLAGDASRPANWRLMVLNVKDGTRKQLAQNVLGRPCCDPFGARGEVYGMAGGELEFYYRQARGNRVQLRAVRVGGESRLIGEVPAGSADWAIVFQNRIIYLESIGDSVRLQFIPGAGRATRTLGIFGSASAAFMKESALSHDGRQLAVGVGSTALFIYSLDAEGKVQESPKPITLPFDWRSPQWLADGSGLLMIGYPRGAAGGEVALVKLADLQHPILLARDDSVDKLGYSLSPDGKFVAYNANPNKGSSIYMIDVAEMHRQLQEQMKKQKQPNK